MKTKAIAGMNPAPKQPDETTYSGRFAARLRMLREKTGMTGQAFVDLLREQDCEVALRTYYNWEAGTSTPSLDLIPSLAAALQLKTIRELFPKE